MGTKRTQDSGRKDSAGRTIKVSGNAATPAAGTTTPSTPPMADFTPEDTPEIISEATEQAQHVENALTMIRIGRHRLGDPVHTLGLLRAMRTGDDEQYRRSFDGYLDHLTEAGKRRTWDENAAARWNDHLDAARAVQVDETPDLPEDVEAVIEAADLLDDRGLDTLGEYSTELWRHSVLDDPERRAAITAHVAESLDREAEGTTWFRDADEARFRELINQARGEN